MRCGTCIVTISYGCNNLKDPIECKNVYRKLLIGPVIKSIGVDPRLGAMGAVGHVIRLITFLVSSESDPDTSHKVGDVDNQKNQAQESNQVTLALFRVFGKHNAQEKFKRDIESI